MACGFDLEHPAGDLLRHAWHGIAGRRWPVRTASGRWCRGPAGRAKRNPKPASTPDSGPSQVGDPAPAIPGQDEVTDAEASRRARRSAGGRAQKRAHSRQPLVVAGADAVRHEGPAGREPVREEAHVRRREQRCRPSGSRRAARPPRPWCPAAGEPEGAGREHEAKSDGEGQGEDAGGQEGDEGPEARRGRGRPGRAGESPMPTRNCREKSTGRRTMTSPARARPRGPGGSRARWPRLVGRAARERRRGRATARARGPRGSRATGGKTYAVPE